jgi:L-lactate dehydrogenase complex protein LldF
MHTVSVPFHRRVETAVHDARLRRALALTTGRLLGARAAAFATFPHEAIRDHARRIRAHTLSRLDEYLLQFIDAVEARGGEVHWADSAADTVRLVVQLAQDRAVRTAVKSKSMVSEEVELNEALEAAGVRVVETDLGEYVVQLAGDRPSHIIAPIIHRTRTDVAELFQRKLGASEADLVDVPGMTALARRVLRREFLRADMGISGVNFGVAETGSLCLVTNEGNGRLTTTVPRIHVALMGIERLVPRLTDLSVMLQVLGRSATGQKLTVYTNILTGPRRRSARAADTASIPARAQEGADAEPDGPDELHVILVDNGRSRLLGSDLAEILYCIRCGACLNACPVYQEIGGHAYGSVYSGPVGSVLTPGLAGIREWSDLPHASSLCGACREVCPVRIDIPRMLLALRSESVQAGGAPRWLRIGMRVYRTIVLRPALYRIAARVVRTITRLAGRRGWLRRLPPPLSNWTKYRDFPAFARRSFLEIWRERGGSHAASRS